MAILHSRTRALNSHMSKYISKYVTDHLNFIDCTEILRSAPDADTCCVSAGFLQLQDPKSDTKD